MVRLCSRFSAVAQRELLNIELHDLQQALMRAWRLPELLVRIEDDRHAETAQVRNVLLAVRAGDTVRKGQLIATANGVDADVIARANGTAAAPITFAAYDNQTKDSLPWNEEFTFANQTKSDEGRTSWTTTRSKGVFEVRENALFINDKGDEGEFHTGEIDISKGPVDISLDAWSQGGVDGKDYVRLYKIVDGGKEALVAEIKGKQSEMTTVPGAAEGKRLVLVIRSKVSSGDEIYRMDNLKVRYR
mgnify:CR=1 FL=1